MNNYIKKSLLDRSLVEFWLLTLNLLNLFHKININLIFYLNFMSQAVVCATTGGQNLSLLLSVRLFIENMSARMQTLLKAEEKGKETCTGKL